MDGLNVYEPEQSIEPSGGLGVIDTLARHKAVVFAVLVVLALVSMFPLRAVFSTPDTYAKSIETLDRKSDTVLALTAASAATSAAISAVPGDAGTPIAEKLMDLSSDFMIVLAAIYLEKYLLTTLGFVSFGILIPAACAMAAFALWVRGRSVASPLFARLAAKVALLGVVLVVTVPTSVFVTNSIERTYEISMNETVESAQDVVESAEKAEDDDKEGILGFIQQIPENVANGISTVATGARDLVNNFIETLAMMIVTSCIIPVLVLLFFVWAANMILGMHLEVPFKVIGPKRKGGR